MTSFIFIVLPILGFSFLLWKGLPISTYSAIIVFVIYIVSAHNVEKDYLAIYKKKRKLILHFFIFPLLSFFILFYLGSEDSIISIVKSKLQSSKPVVYLYNETQDEIIQAIDFSRIENNEAETSIFKQGKKTTTIGSWTETICPTNSILKIRIRSGTYRLQIFTRNKQLGRTYQPFLNNMIPITITEEVPVFLCYDGMRFFQYFPDDWEIFRMEKQFNRDLSQNTISWSTLVQYSGEEK